MQLTAYSEATDALPDLVQTRLQHSSVFLLALLTILIIDRTELLPLHAHLQRTTRLEATLCARTRPLGPCILAFGRLRALDKLQLHKHLVAKIDRVPRALGQRIQHETARAQHLDKGTHVGAFGPRCAVDRLRQLGFVRAILNALDIILLLLLLGAFLLRRHLAALIQRPDTVDGDALLLLHAPEPALDLGDPQLALPAQHAVRLVDEVEPVGAHQREAEDGDVGAIVPERQRGDVGDGDEVLAGPGGLRQVEGFDVDVQRREVWLQAVRQRGHAAAEIGDEALRAVGAGEGLVVPAGDDRAGVVVFLLGFRGDGRALLLLVAHLRAPGILGDLYAPARENRGHVVVHGVLRPHFDLLREAAVVVLEHGWVFAEE
ncbi:hypothetical protein B5807_07367 [Epicoccum nigrum]|uniref:Uncharacterized protein n=1 Tax=Epicoccum nigrum TaxID=105696 RepID=A0A1Y2LV41_EPING|nr:hypothetical protein B5807_07367 [Epicoccum nigrum]